MKDRKLRIWIDLANTPQVLFFEPIVRELERRGHSVAVTSRHFANTQAVIRARGLRATRIGAGHDGGRNEILKQAYHWMRATELVVFARGRRFDVAASHLSYTQAAAARRLRLPMFNAVDYEHTRLEIFRHARLLMAPSIIPAAALERWGIPARSIRPYDGLKEHVYLDRFRPSVDMRAHLGIAPHQLLVTFRPISDHAHYGNDDGKDVQRRLLMVLAAEKDVSVLVLPRTRSQRRKFEALAREFPAIRLKGEAVDGPSLICASDLVVTGGGTMLREAAVLGVPALSCFAGPLGAVDRWLAEQGRVMLVRRVEDFARIHLDRRRIEALPLSNGSVRDHITQGICDAADA